MTKQEQKYALAEFMGYVWYRAPQDHHFPEKKYRFLALPAIQEYEGQIDIWKQRADGTEKIIDSKEWRKAQGVDYVPDFPEDYNAMHEVEMKLWQLEKHTEFVGVLLRMGWTRNKIVSATCNARSEAACRVLFPERWP